MSEIVIDWIESHHAGDDEHDVRSLLEAGGDEGPLIALSCRTGPGRRASAAMLFETVDWYCAHLASYEDEDHDERWVGLVRGTAKANRTDALPTLVHIAHLVTRMPTSDRRPRKRREPRTPPTDYAIAEATVPVTLRLIPSRGTCAAEIVQAYPRLAKALLISPDD